MTKSRELLRELRDDNFGKISLLGNTIICKTIPAETNLTIRCNRQLTIVKTLHANDMFRMKISEPSTERFYEFDWTVK